MRYQYTQTKPQPIQPPVMPSGAVGLPNQKSSRSPWISASPSLPKRLTRVPKDRGLSLSKVASSTGTKAKQAAVKPTAITEEPLTSKHVVRMGLMDQRGRLG